MTLIRALIAAAVFIVPGTAFAAAETTAAPQQPAAEQVLSTAEADRLVPQNPVAESVRDSETVARAPAAPQPAPAKPKAIRPSKLSVARAAPAAAPAPQPSLGCSGYWCGRQLVLMLGVGF